MEKIKIKNFLKEFPNKTFPIYASLSELESKKLLSKIKSSFVEDGSISSLELVKMLDAKAELLDCVNADIKKFDLKDVFNDLRIAPLNKVYIDWYRFNKIDSMRFDDLCQHFDCIWYPGPDDISIFDDSISWILFISHEGYISYVIK